MGWFMIRIDAYYDITCDKCGRSWSTDFEMGMATNKEYLRRDARAAGWNRNKRGDTLCRECYLKQLPKTIYWGDLDK